MMNMGKAALIMVGAVIALYLAIVLLHFIFKTIKEKIRTKAPLRQVIKDTEYFKVTDFLKWCIIDLVGGKDYFKLWGLWIFTGYFGEGKTLGMVAYAKYLQNKHPHKDIKIFSNIAIEGQVAKINNWEDILTLPPSSIVILDEGHADFTATTGKNAFPIELLRKITQMRKKELMIMTTSPVYNRMNIQMRENANFIIESKNFLTMDRWFFYTFYRAEDYDLAYENPDKKRKYVYFKESFIASNKVYNYYDTTEEVSGITNDEEKSGNSKKVSNKDFTALQRDISNLRNEMVKMVELEVRKIKAEFRK